MVKSTLRTKKLKDKEDNPEAEFSKGLIVNCRSKKRENKEKKYRRSKSKYKHLKLLLVSQGKTFQERLP